MYMIGNASVFDRQILRSSNDLSLSHHPSYNSQPRLKVEQLDYITNVFTQTLDNKSFIALIRLIRQSGSYNFTKHRCVNRLPRCNTEINPNMKS